MNPGLIILILLAVFGVVCIIAFIVYRVTHPKLKSNDKPSEDEILKEEMDRLVKPIEDDDVAKQVSEYKDEEDK